MNPQLGREVTRAITKARLSTPELVRRTGLGESWIKQVRTGRIAKPKAEWLRKLAEEVGADPAEWLALSNQLGAAADYNGSSSGDAALITALNRQSQVMEALVILLARREGISLDDLATEEGSMLRKLGHVLQGGLATAATEAIERDLNREPEAPRRPDHTHPTPLPAKP